VPLFGYPPLNFTPLGHYADGETCQPDPKESITSSKPKPRFGTNRAWQMWSRLTNQIVGDDTRHQKGQPLLIARLLN
jgi:hypothetical protein